MESPTSSLIASLLLLAQKAGLGQVMCWLHSSQEELYVRYEEPHVFSR